MKIFMAAFLGIMILASSAVVAEEREWSYISVCTINGDRVVLTEKSYSTLHLKGTFFAMTDMITKKRFWILGMGGGIICKIMDKETYDSRQKRR